MKNAIKDLFLMGIGAASLTKKKAEETVKVFVKKGIINNKQANELIGRVMRETEKVKNKLRKEGVKEIKKVKKNIASVKKKATDKVNNAARKVVRKGMKL